MENKLDLMLHVKDTCRALIFFLKKDLSKIINKKFLMLAQNMYCLNQDKWQIK